MNRLIGHRVLAFVCLCQTLSFTGSVPAQEKSAVVESGYEIAYATYLGGSAWDQAASFT
jgi:hypothetical protein